MINKSPKLKGPLLMNLDVTYQCTLRCLHCFNMSGEHDFDKYELTDEELIDLSHQIALLRPTVICICGGEPLIRKEIIYKCCKIIREESQGNTQVNIVTNGELLTEKVANDLKEAGFVTVQVSIDGATHKSHDWLRNKEGVFVKAINAIKYLKKVGLNVSVACTPTLYNLGEVDEIIKMCEELGVNDFRMQPLMPLGRAITNLENYIPKYGDYKNLALRLNELKYKNAVLGKMSIEWGDPIDHLIRYRRVLNGNNLSFGVNAYGNITISPYLPITFGNIKNHSLIEYWEKGLTYAWEIPIVKFFAEKILSCDSLAVTDSFEKLPLIYYEKGIEIDIIDEDVLNTTVDKVLKAI